MLPAVREPLWPVSERLTGNTPPVLTILPTVTLDLPVLAAPFTVTPFAVMLPAETVPLDPRPPTDTAPVALRLPTLTLNLGVLPVFPTAWMPKLPPVAVMAPALMVPPYEPLAWMFTDLPLSVLPLATVMVAAVGGPWISVIDSLPAEAVTLPFTWIVPPTTLTAAALTLPKLTLPRSEEHTSEL